MTAVSSAVLFRFESKTSSLHANEHPFTLFYLWHSEISPATGRAAFWTGPRNGINLNLVWSIPVNTQSFKLLAFLLLARDMTSQIYRSLEGNKSSRFDIYRLESTKKNHFLSL